jgi:hypothetical protein
MAKKGVSPSNLHTKIPHTNRKQTENDHNLSFLSINTYNALRSNVDTNCTQHEKKEVAPPPIVVPGFKNTQELMNLNDQAIERKE